jgi:murein DD-endopeptidase MepM/ murein hydrolase activator NlpD
MKCFVLCLLTALVLVAPARADVPLTLDGPMKQGGLITGTTAPGAQVFLDGEALPVSEAGHFVFGFGRDHADAATLVVAMPDGRRVERALTVAQREYHIQRIDGLPPAQVTPPDEETIARIRREGEIKRAARPRDTAETWFTEGFIWPAHGPITGVYGSQRILNGEPRTPHYGVDVAGPTGTPVMAPASGVVTLAHPDMYFEGGLIFIDHGHGVIGVLMHLNTVEVGVGQFVRQGERVGTIGATGRATGPHVDWRMFWRDARIDPQLLVPPMEEVAGRGKSSP